MRGKPFGLTHWVWIGIGAGVAWLLLAPPGWASEIVAQGATTTTTQPATGDIGDLLAPMLAAAAGIERVLEMAWNWIENAGRQLVATLGMGQAWAEYAHKQVKDAEDALKALARAGLPKEPGAPGQPGQPAAAGAPGAPGTPPAAADVPPEGSLLQQKIALAEVRLKDAQDHLRSAIDSDRYRSLKQSISVVVGIGLGIVIAFMSGLDMFVLLGLQPATWAGHPFGMLLTGVIIGAGTGPVHSVIGLLQQTRDAVDQVANLFNARAAENKTRALANQRLATAPVVVTTAQPDVGLESGERGLDLGAVPVGPPRPPTAAEIEALNRIARR
jgi:hypothetical protein